MGGSESLVVDASRKLNKQVLSNWSACINWCGLDFKLIFGLFFWVAADVSKEANKKVNDVCNLPPIENTGRQCLAFIPSWTFDAKSGKCVSYVYGGCGKTANLYKTEAECQARCGPSTSTFNNIFK